MRSSLSLPLSILLAGAAIGTGLYFGLRRPEGASPSAPVSPGPVPAPAVPGPVPAPAAPGPVPAPAAPGPVPAPAALTHAEITAHATAQVEGAKPRWTAACWDTADPTTRTPGRYVAGLAFDAEGRLKVSGVSETRGASDPGVAQCLRRLTHDFSIPPPGRYVVVDVPFTMP